jgi:hypothetical protein
MHEDQFVAVEAGTEFHQFHDLAIMGSSDFNPVGGEL